MRQRRQKSGYYVLRKRKKINWLEPLIIIIQESSDNLFLMNDNNLWKLIFHMVILLFGSCMLTTFFLQIMIALFNTPIPPDEILSCTRLEPTQVNCRLQEKTIIKTIEKAPIKLTAAELIEREQLGEDGYYKVYQIELYSKTGKQNFGYIKQDKAELQKIVSQINLFIANPTQPILQVKQSGIILDVSFFAITIVLSFFLIFMGGMAIFWIWGIILYITCFLFQFIKLIRKHI